VRRPDSLWPDPLLEEHSVDVAAGDLQPFYLTVRTRAETPAGEYGGTITIQAEGAPPQSLPLAVHVWGFVLLRESHLRTAFRIYGEQLLKYHRIPGKDDPRYGDTPRAYYRDMLEHRMSPCEIGSNRPAPRVDVLAQKPDFSAWDAWMQAYIDQGLNCFWVPLDGYTDSRERGLRPFLPAGASDAGPTCWEGRSFRRGPRDPGGSARLGPSPAGKGVVGPGLRLPGRRVLGAGMRVPATIDWRQWVHEGDPELRNLLTHTPDAKYPAVDVWCP
jgi:hypothetical protein